MSPSIYLAIPVMMLLTVVQAAVLPRFPILGITPHLALLTTVAWGLLYGVEEGVTWAFAAGIFVDLFSSGPMGATSLAIMGAVTIAILIQRNFPTSRWLLPMVLGGVATLAFWLIYLLLLRIIMPFMINGLLFLGLETMESMVQVADLRGDISSHYSLNGQLINFLLTAIIVHVILILPIYWALYGLGRLRGPRRVEI